MNLPNYKEARVRGKESFPIENFVLDKKCQELGRGKTYYIKTYGCQMNEHDTENIKAILESMGYEETEDMNASDVILLNTCSIRENAHNKAFGMLGRIKHLKENRPNILVGLCGCMAQEEGVVKKIGEDYPFVNFVFGTHNLYDLPQILSNVSISSKQEIEVLAKPCKMMEDFPLKRVSNKKAYVNIIYGCDKFCTYCIVPFTRGQERSRRREDILKEVAALVRDGYMEVTLLGQNVNAYGKDLYPDYSLANLLEDVSRTGIPRIRFMTSHPWDFTDEMIDVIQKYDNIMPSIHLPVQSGSSRVLKQMGRRYTKEEYLTLFKKMRERIPNVTISTDIIVGFPTETEEDFNETLMLAKFCQFDNAFSFIFSKREGTPACKLEDLTTEEEKHRRLHQLNQILNEGFLASNQRLLGKRVPVLVDGVNETNKTALFGYTDTNKLVNFDGDCSLIGKIVLVEITECKTWSLDGKVVSDINVNV